MDSNGQMKSAEVEKLATDAVEEGTVTEVGNVVETGTA